MPDAGEPAAASGTGSPDVEPADGADGPAATAPATTATTTHVVLVHPEIHWNTGSAGRACLAVGATLHLIEPLGFSLGAREVKRAGLDYWPHVDLRVWPNWAAFERELPKLGEPYFFSSGASRPFWDAPLSASDGTVLVFGRETGGLPPELHARYRDRFVTLPIHSPRVRSLNLAMTVGIALYEVLRQRREGGAGPEAGSRSEAGSETRRGP